MNLQEIRKIAKKNLAGRRPNQHREAGYIYYHCLRVANLAGELAGGAGAPAGEFDAVLYTGALFHDVGKGLSGHNETGAVIARKLLADQLEERELDEVCEIVRFHCVRKHGIDLPRRVLLVQDADIIDHYGTQEVWLQFLYSAFTGKSQPKSARHWLSESYGERLAKVRTQLNYDVSVGIFDERVRFQQEFFRRFEQESMGVVYSPGSGGSP